MLFFTVAGVATYYTSRSPWYVYHGTTIMSPEMATGLASKYTQGITVIPCGDQNTTVIYDFGSHDKIPGLEWHRNILVVDYLPPIICGVIGLVLLLYVVETRKVFRS
jgi:hypothetical protein